MTRFTAASLACLLLFACSKNAEQQNRPASSPMAGSIKLELAVYFLGVPPQNEPGVLRDSLAKYPNLKLVVDTPPEIRQMLVLAHFEKNVQRNYPPPKMKSLQYFGRGISREQAAALQQSREALVLKFMHSKENVWTGLQTANLLVEEIARRTGGLVWDEETREIFSPDAWHKKRLESWTTESPDISTQTTIHAYQNAEYVRAITLGMAKVGLPDVVVNDFSWSANRGVGNLINLFCQSMAEGAMLNTPGRFKLDIKSIKNARVRESQVKGLKTNASGTACLSLKEGKKDEGDPENRLIELTADAYSGPDLHAKQESMLSSLFGWEDSITPVEHTAELLEASRKATARLPELYQAFRAGLQPGEFIHLKAPFKTPDNGHEWMWVAVTSWEGSRIKGLLDNEPFDIPSLHAGQIVEIRQEDVFDYIRRYPDKHTEGNTTGAIIEKMEQDRGGPSSSNKQNVQRPAPATPECNR